MSPSFEGTELPVGMPSPVINEFISFMITLVVGAVYVSVLISVSATLTVLA